MLGLMAARPHPRIRRRHIARRPAQPFGPGAQVGVTVHLEGGAVSLRLGAARRDADGTIRLLGEAAGLRVELAVSRPHGAPPRRDATLRVTARRDVRAGLGVHAELGTSDDPGWLIPGLFYGENRPEDCARLYPRFGPGGDELTSEHWSFRADRAATPAVFAWDRRGGVALCSDERSALGLSGVGLALIGARPRVSLWFPFREEPVRFDGSPVARPPVAESHDFRAGETVSAGFSVYRLGRDRREFTQVLRDRHARTPAADPEATAWVSVEDAAALAAHGLWAWHYRPGPPARLAETAAFDRELTAGRLDREAMHVAWISGAPYAAALLAHARRTGRDDLARGAAAVLDGICANRSPSGGFWGQFCPQQGWRAGWTGDANRLHARTLGEAATFVARAARAERAIGRHRRAWERAVRETLEMAVAAQRADGLMPSSFDARDGGAWDHRTSAGLALVPALVEASVLLAEPRYLEAAARAGRRHRRDLERGFLHGAPEDVDSAPTSEDGYVALMAYVALARHDGRGRWLEAARRAADWMLSFRYTYVAFDPHTILGAYGFRTRGADQASPSNQHLHAYGLICLPELRWLADATDDGYYRAGAAEALGCFRQFVARADGDFGARKGMVSERYHQTDCFAPKGMLLGLSHAWCVGVLLLACEAVLAPAPQGCAALPA
jgi:hypothetical protein